MHNFAAAAVRTFVTRCWDNVYISFKPTRYLIQSRCCLRPVFCIRKLIGHILSSLHLPECLQDVSTWLQARWDAWKLENGSIQMAGRCRVLYSCMGMNPMKFIVNKTGFRSQLPAACWLSQLEETTIKIAVWPSCLLLAPESFRSLSSGHWSASMFCGTRKSFRLTTTWTTMMQFLPHLPLWSRRLELAGIPKVLS